MNTRLSIFAGLVLALLATGCAQKITAQQQLLLDRGEEAFRAKRYSQAADNLSRFVSEAPSETASYDKALYMRGMSYAQTGQRQQAYRDLELAARSGRDPEIAWKSYVSLGTLRYEDRQWGLAAIAYRAAADRMPNASPKETVLIRLATAYERSGQWSKAQLPLKELLDRFPNTPAGRDARQRLNRNRSQRATVTRSSPTTTPQAPRKTSGVTRRAPAPGGNFAVQAGVFSVAGNADKQVNRLRSQNLNAYVRREVVQRQARYVVLVGPFNRIEDAQRMLGRVKQTVPDAIMWP